MGGNAIKNVPIRRYNKEEYEKIAREVVQKLNEWAFDNMVKLRAYVVETFRSKETFGDLDVIVSTNMPMDINYELADIFDSKEVIPNGPYMSFEYKEFQIDFIFVPPEEFEFAKVYHGCGDIGNLIGKTARSLGLEYGSQGLIYSLRNGLGDLVGEVPVTLDPKAALEFLGYDFDRFHQGFDTQEDVFKFVASSKYFNAEAYAFENLNHVDRRRDEKRPSYKAFLAWVAAGHAKTKFTPEADKSKYLCWTRKAFPEFAMQYDLTSGTLQRVAAGKAKFNGSIVSGITGLVDKELGAFIKSFKAWFKTPDDFLDYVIYTKPVNIATAVLNHLKVRNEQEK